MYLERRVPFLQLKNLEVSFFPHCRPDFYNRYICIDLCTKGHFLDIHSTFWSNRFVCTCMVCLIGVIGTGNWWWMAIGQGSDWLNFPASWSEKDGVGWCSYWCWMRPRSLPHNLSSFKAWLYPWRPLLVLRSGKEPDQDFQKAQFTNYPHFSLLSLYRNTFLLPRETFSFPKFLVLLSIPIKELLLRAILAAISYFKSQKNLN